MGYGRSPSWPLSPFMTRLYAHMMAAAVRSAPSAGPAVTPAGPPLAHHLRPVS